MMSTPDLKTMKIEIDGEIGTLTLDRPDAFNAMSPEMIGEMLVAFAWLADRAPLRALIITGAGNAFCAGGDVTVFRKGVEDEELDLPSEVRRGAEALHTAIVDLRRIAYPVIAAVNGPAAGVGFVVACFADIRFAAAGAKLTTSFGRLGLPAEHGVSWVLPRLVGIARAADLLLSSRVVLAEEAERMGLVNAVVAPGEVLPHTLEYARRIAAEISPWSLLAIKGQLYADQLRSLDESATHAEELMRESFGSSDFKEGVAALSEKRRPVFGVLA